MKLSDDQKEIITLMRRGWKLSEFYVGFEIFLFKKREKIISPHDFMIIKAKKLIEEIRDSGVHRYYLLTELGKTIQL